MAYGAIIGQTPTVQASAEMTSYNNDNTSSVITADNVQGAIDQLFTFVSNGKSQIASAITGMGVSTSANATFAQMATNIGNIKTGPDWSEVENPAEAAQILAPYQTYDSSNKLIKGTITSKGAQTYTPKTVSQTIAKGQYLSGNQIIQGDGNLVASNIKKGVSIFGVSGSYTGGYLVDKNTGNINVNPGEKLISFMTSYNLFDKTIHYIIGSTWEYAERQQSVFYSNLYWNGTSGIANYYDNQSGLNGFSVNIISVQVNTMGEVIIKFDDTPTSLSGETIGSIYIFYNS